jgi:23S rRNA pseudouridine2604 synthase
MSRPILKLPPKPATEQPAPKRRKAVRPLFGAQAVKKAAANRAAAATFEQDPPASGRDRQSPDRRSSGPRSEAAGRAVPGRTGAPRPDQRRPTGETAAGDTDRRKQNTAANGETSPDFRSRRRPEGSTKERFSTRERPPSVPPATRSRSARPPAPAPSDPPRLSKVMADRGLCSRREADTWIENGWVRVDGAVVDTLGTRVPPEARIEIEPAARADQVEAVTILLHKPVGVVSGQAEEGYKPASSLIRPENRWEEDPLPIRFRQTQLRGLAPAGRLDIDSTGLLVLTQDGRIARKLIGQDTKVEKEYLVRVEGTPSPQALRLLNHGLSLDGAQLKPAKVSWQNEEQLRFVLREGKKRQIRRMCELVGLKVTGLKRVRIGSVGLGKLPPGKWRYLRQDERF